MKLSFWFDRVNAEGDVKTKIARKLAGLDKYLKHVSSDLREGWVKLSRGERWGYKVKVDLKIPGKDVVAEGRDENLLTAVDQVMNKLQQGLTKKRGKEKTKWKK
jgi:ribosomal subunit interface protein